MNVLTEPQSTDFSTSRRDFTISMCFITNYPANSPAPRKPQSITSPMTNANPIPKTNSPETTNPSLPAQPPSYLTIPAQPSTPQYYPCVHAPVPKTPIVMFHLTLKYLTCAALPGSAAPFPGHDRGGREGRAALLLREDLAA